MVEIRDALAFSDLRPLCHSCCVGMKPSFSLELAPVAMARKALVVLASDVTWHLVTLDTVALIAARHTIVPVFIDSMIT